MDYNDKEKFMAQEDLNRYGFAKDRLLKKQIEELEYLASSLTRTNMVANQTSINMRVKSVISDLEDVKIELAKLIVL